MARPRPRLFLGLRGVLTGIAAGVLALVLACLGFGCSGSDQPSAAPAPATSEPAAPAPPAPEPAPAGPAADPIADPAADYALADVTFNYLVAPASTVAQTLAALQDFADSDSDFAPEPISVPGSLADFAGRPLVINFWASWCPPCVLEMPEFEKVHQAFGAEGQALGAETQTPGAEVAFLGVNVQDDPEDALNLATQTGVSYPLAADPEADIQFDFAIISLPATLFISADGQELDRWLGVLDETELVNRITANFGEVGGDNSDSASSSGGDSASVGNSSSVSDSVSNSGG